jgi:hypothetical protein
LRLEGFAASVAYRTERLSALLAPFGTVRAETDKAAVQETWRAVRDVERFAGAPGDVWRISVKPSDAPDIAALSQGEAVFDWGGGLIWVRVADGTDLRARLGAFAGHATLVRASEETRARIAPFQPEAAPIAALSEGLRKQFDPQGHPEPRPHGRLRRRASDALTGGSRRASVRRGLRRPVADVRPTAGSGICARHPRDRRDTGFHRDRHRRRSVAACRLSASRRSGWG